MSATSRLWSLALPCIVAAFAAGCSDQSPPSSSPTSPLAPAVAQRALSLQAAGYVLTPAGWFYKSCIYAFPSAAKVSIDNVVTRKDGSTYRIQKCPYPPHLTLPHPNGRGGLVQPNDTGWVEYAYDFAPSGNRYRDLADTFVVPQPPSQTYSGNEVLFSFPGIQNPQMILQPVLQYGKAGGQPFSFGGNHWTIAGWWCDGSMGNCYHSDTVKTVDPGDTLYGTVDASACAAGICTWTVNIVDLSKIPPIRAAPLTRTDSDTYTFATGGAMETHNGFTSCSAFPPAGFFHRGLYFADLDGQVTPSWVDLPPSNPNPDCGFDVTSTSTTVSDIVNPPPPPHPSVSLTGPQYANAYSYVTVYATASGGTPPYTYSWTVDGSPYCGDATSCTAQLGAGGTTTWFTATVTDSLSRQGSASLGVYACPSGAAPCQAPASKSGGA